MHSEQSEAEALGELNHRIEFIVTIIGPALLQRTRWPEGAPALTSGQFLRLGLNAPRVTITLADDATPFNAPVGRRIAEVASSVLREAPHSQTGNIRLGCA